MGRDDCSCMKAGEGMTDEEKKEYRAGMIELCKTYCHIDYDDDAEIVALMFDTTMEDMENLIPSFDRYAMTSRQKLLACISTKELYDHREEYQKETRTLTNAVSSMLLKEIYKGGNA